MPEVQAKQTNFTFPQEIEVTLTLKVHVTDQEQRDAWLNPETSAVSPEALADILDVLSFDGLDSSVKTINNLTKDQIQQILNENAAL